MSSSFYFWTHFVLVTISHFLVVVLAISTVMNFIRSTAPLLDRGRRFAIIFFLTVLGVNHLTNTSSKCLLTTLENEARAKEGKEQVGDFMPRYYKSIGKWFDV
jgi:hypothetical protein